MRSLFAAIRSLFAPATLTDYAHEGAKYDSQRELAAQRATDPAWVHPYAPKLSLAKPAHPNLLTNR